tara:strand:+ start:1496 stop:1663 length:168 start_codon:yes stop_codon:yes gene_type:complete
VKKSDKFKIPLRVDDVTNEYIIAVPESYVNDLGWYEDTEVNVTLEGDGIFIEESK